MLGARVFVGHSAEHVGGIGTVVTSSAIRTSNPDLVAARERGIRILPRAAALASMMTGQRGVAVAGTAGKTTSTSMIAVAMQSCGLDPSYAIGGDLNEPGSNAHAGRDPFFVAEADESDRSFLLLSPEVALVTNVEPDHLDNYGRPEAVYEAFAEFVGKVSAGGRLVVGADDAGSRALAPVAMQRGLKTVSFGLAPDADVRIENLVARDLGSRCEIVANGRRLGPLLLTVPGQHNALNATGAIAVGLQLGLSFTDMARGLADFSGARRRFELKGTSGGVRVFDDYAHHPTKVRAALESARLVARQGRVIVVFQPHLFSRTQHFAGQFGQALARADAVIVMDVYGAREDPVPGVTGALVAEAVPLPADRVVFEPSWSAVPHAVARVAKPGDVVVTVGAGDVTMLGPQILAALATDRT
jgi:UDP-N-acetylmuramate--alanine ligase